VKDFAGRGKGLSRLSFTKTRYRVHGGKKEKTALEPPGKEGGSWIPRHNILNGGFYAKSEKRAPGRLQPVASKKKKSLEGCILRLRAEMAQERD